MISKSNSNSHPLHGDWRSDDEEYDNVVYSIRQDNENFTVSGIDESDGEQFEISNIKWDGKSLSFTSLMPSTNWQLDHVFTIISETKIEHVTIRTETWENSANKSSEPIL